MIPRFNYNLEYLFLDEWSGDTVLTYICEITGDYVVEYSGIIYQFSDRQNAIKMLENCTFIGVI